MSPLPVKMRNRWENRVEPEPGRGTVYWHMLMHPYPQVCDVVADAQKSLAHFRGLHMTPREWLHVTALVAGSTDEITREQMSAMVSRARELLRDMPPIPVTLGTVFYHPEAIMLPVRPADALLPVLAAAKSATREIIGSDDDPPSLWFPHVTISYSTAEQPAGPIISALGKTVRQRQVGIDSMTLVIQWGSEKRWDWEPVGTAHLARK
jgi:2'-5' RNA ligase